MNANTESPYIKWRRQEYQKKGLDFYLEQIKRDFKQAKKAVKRADRKEIFYEIDFSGQLIVMSYT